MFVSFRVAIDLCEYSAQVEPRLVKVFIDINSNFVLLNSFERVVEIILIEVAGKSVGTTLVNRHFLIIEPLELASLFLNLARKVLICYALRMVVLWVLWRNFGCMIIVLNSFLNLAHVQQSITFIEVDCGVAT